MACLEGSEFIIKLDVESMAAIGRLTRAIERLNEYHAAQQQKETEAFLREQDERIAEQSRRAWDKREPHNGYM